MKTRIPNDKSRCAGHLCPDRETCLRHTCETPPNGRDVPQVLAFLTPQATKCKFRIDNERGKTR